MTQIKQRRIVVLTPRELDLVIEAVGEHKKKLRSKAMKMRRRHGVNPQGKHTLRWERIRIAQVKLTDVRESFK